MFCALLLYTSICYKYHTSPQNAVHFVAATVQQQSRFKLFPVTDRTQGSYGMRTKNAKCGPSSASLFLLRSAAVHVSPRPPSSVPRGSHGATAVAFRGIPFVAATVFLCVCVPACLCIILTTIWTIATHISPKFQSTRASADIPS